MSLTLQTVARNAACDAVVDLADAGAGAGKLKLKTSGGTLLITFTLKDPAFEAAGTGAAGQARLIGGDGATIISAGNPLTAVASATGDLTGGTYDVTDSTDAVKWSGQIGSDMTVDDLTVTSGVTYALNTFAHTQPA